MPTIPARIPRTLPCNLCGCHDQRRCQTIGTPCTKDDPHTSQTSTIALHARPVFTCRMKPGDVRCSNCQTCHQCGGPLGAKPGLVLAGGRKIRLCDAQDCVIDGETVRLPGCKITPTGDPGLDGLLEALLTGDPVVVKHAAARWKYRVPEEACLPHQQRRRAMNIHFQ